MSRLNKYLFEGFFIKFQHASLPDWAWQIPHLMLPRGRPWVCAEKALWRRPAHTGGSWWGGQVVPAPHSKILEAAMLQGWRPHHQLHGGRLRGHPYRRRYCLQEHCIWRGWKSRAFSLHLRPSGHLWGGTRLTAGMIVWLEADPVHLTATAYKDIASLVQNQAALAVQGKPPPGRRRINKYRTMPSAGGRASGAASAWLDIRHRKPGRQWRFRLGGRGRGFTTGQRWNRGRGRSNHKYPYWDK